MTDVWELQHWVVPKCTETAILRREVLSVAVITNSEKHINIFVSNQFIALFHLHIDCLPSASFQNHPFTLLVVVTLSLASFASLLQWRQFLSSRAEESEIRLPLSQWIFV